VYAFSTFGKGRRDYLRTDNSDLNNSNLLLRAEKEGLQEIIKNQTETIASLRGVANQTPAVTALITQTAKQHGEVIKQLTELATEMAKIPQEFSRVALAITANGKSQKGRK